MGGIPTELSCRSADQENGDDNAWCRPDGDRRSACVSVSRRQTLGSNSLIDRRVSAAAALATRKKLTPNAKQPDLPSGSSDWRSAARPIYR
jgi:succinate dehydrogenase / fumarate reductase flavoprotein subunit